MGPLDPDEYQKLLTGHDELDNAPVQLTRYQAQKCAGIITAGLDGHTAYQDQSANVARFLQTAALEAGGVPSALTQSARELWQILDDLPWPTPGPPTTQPT